MQPVKEFNSFLFSRDNLGLMGFKKLCWVAPQCSVWETKCPGFFQVKKTRLSAKAYENLVISTVVKTEKKTCVGAGQP